MKVYIAAPYEMRREACSTASWLESQGIEVTSRWLAGEAGEQSAWAQNDLDDIDRADLYIRDIQVNPGLSMKRSMPRARGSAYPIRKRTSHISLVLDTKPAKIAKLPKTAKK